MRWRRLGEQVIKIVKLKERSFQKKKKIKQTERRNDKFNRERMGVKTRLTEVKRGEGAE